MRYDVWRADGAHEVIETDGVMELGEMQGLVDGYIEVVRFGEQILIVNEEGFLRDLPRNKKFPHLVGTVIQTEIGGIE